MLFQIDRDYLFKSQFQLLQLESRVQNLETQSPNKGKVEKLLEENEKLLQLVREKTEHASKYKGELLTAKKEISKLKKVLDLKEEALTDMRLKSQSRSITYIQKISKFILYLQITIIDQFIQFTQDGRFFQLLEIIYKSQFQQFNNKVRILIDSTIYQELVKGRLSKLCKRNNYSNNNMRKKNNICKIKQINLKKSQNLNHLKINPFIILIINNKIFLILISKLNYLVNNHHHQVKLLKVVKKAQRNLNQLIKFNLKFQNIQMFNQRILKFKIIQENYLKHFRIKIKNKSHLSKMIKDKINLKNKFNILNVNHMSNQTNQIIKINK